MLAANGALVLGAAAVRRRHVRAERRQDGEDATTQTTSVDLPTRRVARQLVCLRLHTSHVHIRTAGRTRRPVTCTVDVIRNLS